MVTHMDKFNFHMNEFNSPWPPIIVRFSSLNRTIIGGQGVLN